VLRTEHPLNDEIKRKVALFCNVTKEAVIESQNVSTIYEVPIRMQKEKLDETVLNKLNIPLGERPDLKPWKSFLSKHNNPQKEVTIGLVGKYVELKDSYKSINESFVHAGAYNQVKVKIQHIQSEHILLENVEEKLCNLDGILVAPGFGNRGIEGKVLAVQYAREKNIPFLGICLGMQCAVIEFARNVMHLEGVNSTEMEMKCKNPVIDLMAEQKMITDMGGTMRLGGYPCRIVKDSIVYNAYKTSKVVERHRHRYEFNNFYKSDFEKAGMVPVGINPDTGLVEIVEIPAHKWFVGVQFHPEYKSTVLNPHPIFVAFVKATI
jgi:CTP synthase